jgi:hypothetical protein
MMTKTNTKTLKLLNGGLVDSPIGPYQSSLQRYQSEREEFSGERRQRSSLPALFTIGSTARSAPDQRDNLNL